MSDPNERSMREIALILFARLKDEDRSAANEIAKQIVGERTRMSPEEMSDHIAPYLPNSIHRERMVHAARGMMAERNAYIAAMLDQDIPDPMQRRRVVVEAMSYAVEDDEFRDELFKRGQQPLDDEDTVLAMEEAGGQSLGQRTGTKH